MADILSNLTDNGANLTSSSLTYKGRPASLDVTGQQPYLFPFDAWEFDDPNSSDEPQLSLKDPWVLVADKIVVGGITLGSFTETLSDQLETAMLLAEDNRETLYDSNTVLYSQAEEIVDLGEGQQYNTTLITQNSDEIALQAISITDLEDDVETNATNISTNAAEISLQADQIALAVTAYDDDGVVEGASIKINSDGTSISNTLKSDTLIDGEPAWEIEEDGDASFQSVSIKGYAMGTTTGSYTVTVDPSGGDYTTISAALLALSQSYQTFVNGGVEVIIEVADDFVMQEHIEISGVNLGFIKITNAGSGDIYYSMDDDDPVFLITRSGVSPEMDLDITDTSYTDYGEVRTFIEIQDVGIANNVDIRGTDFKYIYEVDDAGQLSNSTGGQYNSAYSSSSPCLYLSGESRASSVGMRGSNAPYIIADIGTTLSCSMYTAPTASGSYAVESYGRTSISFNSDSTGDPETYNILSASGGFHTVQFASFVDAGYFNITNGAIVTVGSYDTSMTSANISPNTFTSTGIYYEHTN